MTADINLPKLEKGRLPEADNECVADSHFFSGKDLGKTIKITDENDADCQERFTYGSYKIVGIVNSPNYIMKEERGTTFSWRWKDHGICVHAAGGICFGVLHGDAADMRKAGIRVF